jgi:hypothetical protein
MGGIGPQQCLFNPDGAVDKVDVSTLEGQDFALAELAPGCK